MCNIPINQLGPVGDKAIAEGITVSDLLTLTPSATTEQPRSAGHQPHLADYFDQQVPQMHRPLRYRFMMNYRYTTMVSSTPTLDIYLKE